MKLHRPHIPLRIRLQVAERQYRAAGGDPDMLVGFTVAAKLEAILRNLFDYEPVELHHRPALCNRFIDTRGKTPVYSPDAIDPDYLVYVTKADHDIETRVRGQHGQYSDQALLRKRKRIERKAKRPKRKWPSRPFPKRRKK